MCLRYKEKIDFLWNALRDNFLRGELEQYIGPSISVDNTCPTWVEDSLELYRELCVEQGVGDHNKAVLKLLAQHPNKSDLFTRRRLRNATTVEVRFCLRCLYVVSYHAFVCYVRVAGRTESSQAPA